MAEIGTNPFTPLADAKPDRTADGLKAAMSVIAAAFENSGQDELNMSSIIKYSNMHRLKLERYLNQAISEKFVSKSVINYYSVTNDGYEYLVNHGILDA